MRQQGCRRGILAKKAVAGATALQGAWRIFMISGCPSADGHERLRRGEEPQAGASARPNGRIQDSRFKFPGPRPLRGAKELGNGNTGENKSKLSGITYPAGGRSPAQPHETTLAYVTTFVKQKTRREQKVPCGNGTDIRWKPQSFALRHPGTAICCPAARGARVSRGYWLGPEFHKPPGTLPPASRKPLPGGK